MTAESSEPDATAPGGATNPTLDEVLRRAVRRRSGSLPPLPARLGPYRIEDLIGRGGMGAVYRATDVRLGRQIAVKVLGHSEASGTQSLWNEARSAARVRHPNIVTVHAVEEIDGWTLLTMEYVAGAAVRKVARQSQEMSVRRRWALELAAAVATLHEHRMMHRDIKPENVLVDQHGSIKLVDFGLAQDVRAEHVPGALAGTPEYMAPELRLGAPPDLRSDVFSLALTCLEILSGQDMRRASSDEHALNTVSRSVLPRLVQQLGPEVARVLERGLRVDPDDRFRDARDFNEALAGAMAPVRATAEPIPGPSQLGRRLRGIAVASAIAAAVALGAFMTAGGSDDRADSQVRPETGQLQLATRLSRSGPDDPVVDVSVEPVSPGRIAFVDARGALYLVDSTGRSRVLMTDAPEHVTSISWLTGHRLAVTVAGASTQILALPAHGPLSVTAVIEGAFPTRAQRGPIDFTLRRGTDLIALDHRGEEIASIPAGDDAWMADSAVAVSPDGTEVAFVPSDVSGVPRRVRVWRPHAGTVRDLWTHDYLMQADARIGIWWTRSGVHVAVAQVPPSEHGTEIHRIDDAGSSEVVASFPFVVSNLEADSEGRVVGLRSSLRFETYFAAIDRSAAMPALGAPDRIAMGPDDRVSAAFDDRVWSTVAGQVVSFSGVERLVRGDVRLLGTATSPMTWPQPLAGGGLVAWTWSDDGPTIEPELVHLDREGTARRILRAERITRLAAGAPPYASRVRCALRARACFLSSVRDDIMTIASCNLDSGALTPVRTVAVRGRSESRTWNVSADAERLVWSDSDGVLYVDDVVVRPADPCATPDGAAIDPSTGNIWFLAVSTCGVAASHTLRVLDASTGLESVAWQPTIGIPGYFALSPSGDHVAISVNVVESNAWIFSTEGS